ncbi:hypothetical protein BH11ACT5_BH11ACT5_15310 [soil metagenome]
MTETVVARLRPHARALFWPTLVLLIVAAGVGFLSGTFREQWQNTVLLSVAGAVALVGWLVPLLRWAGRNYTITTRRVVVASGLLARVRREILLGRVNDVSVERLGLQSVFRSGNVVINGEIVLADVPSARLVQAAIHELADAASQLSGSDRLHE